jgi:hypothetical protein
VDPFRSAEQNGNVLNWSGERQALGENPMPNPTNHLLPIAFALVAALAAATTTAAETTTRPGSPATQPAKQATDTVPGFAALLEAVVTADGLVRYDVLEQSPHRSRLDAVIKTMATADLPKSRNGRLAFWSNAYNANVLAKLIAARAKPGFESVIKVDGFFDADRITVAGESITLNDLENKRIRPLGDPRIHAALVCAAISCPPLRDEPFAAERLDEQFDDQCRRWVNDREKFRVVDGKLGVSQILNWYGDDFRQPPFKSPAEFVLAYAKKSSDVVRFVERHDGDPPITFLDYDWSPNEAPKR